MSEKSRCVRAGRRFRLTQRVATSVLVAMCAGCDPLSQVTSGVQDGIRSLRETVDGGDSETAKVVDPPADPGAGSAADEEDDSSPTEPVAEPVSLSAFNDFRCSGEWTNRDGGLGLRAGSGSGVCLTTFPGAAARYQVLLMAQTEFDGDPIYEISINGAKVKSGRFPYSTGRLVCDCPNWRVNCPDKVVAIDIGVHELDTDYAIEFYGKEVYPCGKHGAYAKWRGMEFIPVPAD